jgi:predicted alpha/beta hydrolase
MPSQEIIIPCGDGIITGHLLRPEGVVRRAIVIHPATGVPEAYYRHFAIWLSAAQDAVVLTYGYRGTEPSALATLKLSTLTMSDWGIADQSAALECLRNAAPGLPVWVIGHSLGALFTPWHAAASQIERVIAVASGPAYLTRHPVAFLPKVFWFWFLGGPLFTKLFGYMPGKWVGLSTNLPRNVYWQWRRWCLSRDFHRPEWGRNMPVPDLSAFKGRLSLVAVTDDVMIPPASVKMLSAFYPEARVDYREIAPADIRVASIGHTAIFARRNSKAWPLLFQSQDTLLAD